MALISKKMVAKKLGACSGREANTIMVKIKFLMHDLPFIALSPIFWVPCFSINLVPQFSLTMRSSDCIVSESGAKCN